jgi:hypothetical protein
LRSSTCPRGRELYDLGLLLDDDRSAADIQRWASRDPYSWITRIVELQRLVNLGQCLLLLAVVAGIVPEELQRDIEASRPPAGGG